MKNLKLQKLVKTDGARVTIDFTGVNESAYIAWDDPNAKLVAAALKSGAIYGCKYRYDKAAMGNLGVYQVQVLDAAEVEKQREEIEYRAALAEFQAAWKAGRKGGGNE